MWDSGLQSCIINQSSHLGVSLVTFSIYWRVQSSRYDSELGPYKRELLPHLYWLNKFLASASNLKKRSSFTMFNNRQLELKSNWRLLGAPYCWLEGTELTRFQRRLFTTWEWPRLSNMSQGHSKYLNFCCQPSFFCLKHEHCCLRMNVIFSE